MQPLLPSSVMIDFAEEELRSIDVAFRSGEMNAFSSKESSVLKQIDTISQLQVRAFLNTMRLELKWVLLFFFPPQFLKFQFPKFQKSRNPNVDEEEKERFEKSRSEEYEDFKDNQFGKVAKSFAEKEKEIVKLQRELQKIAKAVNGVNEAILSSGGGGSASGSGSGD